MHQYGHSVAPWVGMMIQMSGSWILPNLFGRFPLPRHRRQNGLGAFEPAIRGISYCRCRRRRCGIWSTQKRSHIQTWDPSIILGESQTMRGGVCDKTTFPREKRYHHSRRCAAFRNHLMTWIPHSLVFFLNYSC